MERKSANLPIYQIPIRQIVANTNPRNPLSEALQKRGYDVFSPIPDDIAVQWLHQNGGKIADSLWKLATSESPEERATYVKLIQECDPDIAALGATILSQGQLQPVEVRDNGKSKSGNTYTLSFGCRRCLAILFNWCLTGTPKEPVVQARLIKGNNSTMLQRAIIENVRKQPNAIEEAKAFQMAINSGLTKAELAEQQGVTDQTIRNRLALLELPIDTQNKIKAGTLTATKALQPTEKQPSLFPKVKSRKELEQAQKEFGVNTTEFRVLDWVLGIRDNIN